MIENTSPCRKPVTGDRIENAERRNRMNEDVCGVRLSCLELALDVNASEGEVPMRQDNGKGLATGEDEVAVLFGEERCAAMVDYELGRIGIRLEEQLFRNKTQGNDWFISIEGIVSTSVAVIVQEGKRKTYALEMRQRAWRRSRLTNMSINQPPMLGVWANSRKKRW